MGMIEDRPSVTFAATITIMTTVRSVISFVAAAANISGCPKTVREDEATIAHNLMDTTHEALRLQTRPRLWKNDMDKDMAGTEDSEFTTQS